MNTIRPTVLDVSRAIAELDVTDHSDPGHGEALRRVASNLAWQFSRHNSWGGRKHVSKRDVRAALITHGASTLTVEHFAGRIASRIRSDFSDGQETL